MDWADDTAYSLNDVADGISAGFITIGKIERWAERRDDLGEEDNAHLADLLRTIRRDRVEARMNRKIGEFIAAATLEKAPENFLSDATARYRYRLAIDPAILAECRLYSASLRTGLPIPPAPATGPKSRLPHLPTLRRACRTLHREGVARSRSLPGVSRRNRGRDLFR